MHLDNVAGKSKDQQSGLIDKGKPDGYCDVCYTRFNNKRSILDRMNIKKILNRKNLLKRSGKKKFVS